MKTAHYSQAIAQKAERRRQKDAAEAAQRARQEAPLRVLKSVPPPDKTPVLSYAQQLASLGHLHFSIPPLREPEKWRPVGKARETLVRSAVSHLYVRYPVAGHFYDPWLNGNDADPLRRLLPHLGSGKSLKSLVGTPACPWALTNKQCHLLTTLSGYSLQGAFRVAIAKSFDAPKIVQNMLAQEWLDRFINERYPFWTRFIQWVSSQGMFPETQLRPIVDFLRHRPDDWQFTGRTVDSVLALVHAWHRDLNAEMQEVAPNTNVPYTTRYKPLEHKVDSAKGTFTWIVAHIPSYSHLRQEGQKMHHCVGSYHSMIVDGRTEIWSLRGYDGVNAPERVATIEVNVAQGEIVQFRGHCNAPVDFNNAMQRWANMNGLKKGRWL